MGSAKGMTRPTPLEPLIDAVENAAALDGIGKAAGKQVRSLIKQPAKDRMYELLGGRIHDLLRSYTYLYPQDGDRTDV